MHSDTKRTNILQAMKDLGLVDKSYGVKLMGSPYEHLKGKYLPGTMLMPLSEAATLGYAGLASMLAIAERTSLELVLFEGADRVGVITCGGRVQLNRGSLREVLGYCIATDGGSEWSVKDVPLDGYVQRLLHVVRSEGTCKHAFFDHFMGMLPEIYRNKFETHYGDGYCGISWCVWKAVTRELGQEHPGYEFAF